MTLKELAADYRRAAIPVRQRLRELRQAEKAERDPEALFWLKRRQAELTSILTELNDLAEWMENYYERSYYHDKYRI